VNWDILGKIREMAAELGEVQFYKKFMKHEQNKKVNGIVYQEERFKKDPLVSQTNLTYEQKASFKVGIPDSGKICKSQLSKNT